MYAAVFRPNKVDEAPRLYGPFYMVEAAFDAVNPTGRGELVVYDLSRPVGTDMLYEVVGRIFTSGRRHLKQEYYDTTNRLP